MRGLSGDFATMPLRDLVVYLGNRRLTGRLDLERDGVRKQVVMEEGDVINASSNIPREYLGQFLINLGHINEEQFERAYATQRETKVFLGRILVMIGLVSEETVQGALLVKFRETLLEAFGWSEGTFLFEPTAAEGTDGLEVRLPLLEVYKESELRVQAWQQIRAVFPRGDLTFRLNRDQLEEAPRPGSLDEKLFQFIEQTWLSIMRQEGPWFLLMAFGALRWPPTMRSVRLNASICAMCRMINPLAWPQSFCSPGFCWK